MTEAADEFFDLFHEAEAGAAEVLDPLEDDPLEDPAAAIRQQCAQWVEAVQGIRFQPGVWPGAQASPFQVMEALVAVRGRLDQVEQVLGSLVGLKSSTALRARQLEENADDAWDNQADEERRSRRPRPEWQGAKERYAYWNLAIREQRHQARCAREMADYVRCCHDQVRLAYDGLDSIRRDLNARLTHLRWETSQEQ